jgi:hypothetical protein
VRQGGQSAGRAAHERNLCKITELRQTARREPGVAVECLLAAFGTPIDEDDVTDTARKYVGALIILDAAHELTNIRKALTSDGGRR